jgi:hypothetical protein
MFKQMMVGVFGPGMEQVFNRVSPQGHYAEIGESSSAQPAGTQGRFLLHNFVSGSHELIRQKVYHACWSRTTRSLRLAFWAPHLLSLDPRLLQFPVPQALNPSLLAFSQARRAPLSFLPDVLVFLFFLISPSLVSLPFPWVINDLIYF